MSAYLAGYNPTPAVYPALPPLKAPPEVPEDREEEEMKRRPPRPCAREGCGKLFESAMVVGKTKYCSRRCRHLVEVARSAERAKASRQPRCLVNKKCAICRDVFETKNRVKKYCSAKCRERYMNDEAKRRNAAKKRVGKPDTDRLGRN